MSDSESDQPKGSADYSLVDACLAKLGVVLVALKSFCFTTTQPRLGLLSAIASTQRRVSCSMR